MPSVNLLIIDVIYTLSNKLYDRNDCYVYGRVSDVRDFFTFASVTFSASI